MHFLDNISQSRLSASSVPAKNSADFFMHKTTSQTSPRQLEAGQCDHHDDWGQYEGDENWNADYCQYKSDSHHQADARGEYCDCLLHSNCLAAHIDGIERSVALG